MAYLNIEELCWKFTNRETGSHCKETCAEIVCPTSKSNAEDCVKEGE